MKRIISLLAIVGLVLTVFPATAGLAAPKLVEGDVISATDSDDPDVYIVNEHGFKRLFLNPQIFRFYGHLGGFGKVKRVTAEAREEFETSMYFRNCENGDPKVYAVTVTGEDEGMLHWVDVTGGEAVEDDPDFFLKVFCINNQEFNWYKKGKDYTSKDQVPGYARGKDKVTLCHEEHTITVGAPAKDAHLRHGDTEGTCGEEPTETPEPTESPTPTPTPGPGDINGTVDDSNSRYPRLVGDEQTVTAARFKFTAANETFKISRLNLEIPDATGIVEVRIMDGTTQVMALPAATDMTFDITDLNRPTVQANQSKTLDIVLVLGTIMTPGGGNSGANHTVTLDKSESRAIRAATGTETAISGDDLVGELLYAYRSVPLVGRLDLPSSTLIAGGATGTIAKFSIGSGGTGAIGWIRTMFSYGLGDSITSLSGVAVYDANNQSTPIAGTISSTSSSITFLADEEQGSGDYVVKATVNGTTTGDDYVTVTWNNSGLTYTAPTASASVGTSATFIWTDRSRSSHSESTADWNNDYLVKNLPLDSWSLND
jgi:hypothetical protein